jgi:hypothetical protein
LEPDQLGCPLLASELLSVVSLVSVELFLTLSSQLVSIYGSPERSETSRRRGTYCGFGIWLSFIAVVLLASRCLCIDAIVVASLSLSCGTSSSLPARFVVHHFDTFIRDDALLVLLVLAQWFIAVLEHEYRMYHVRLLYIRVDRLTLQAHTPYGTFNWNATTTMVLLVTRSAAVSCYGTSALHVIVAITTPLTGLFYT